MKLSLSLVPMFPTQLWGEAMRLYREGWGSCGIKLAASAFTPADGSRVQAGGGVMGLRSPLFIV